MDWIGIYIIAYIVLFLVCAGGAWYLFKDDKKLKKEKLFELLIVLIAACGTVLTIYAEDVRKQKDEKALLSTFIVQAVNENDVLIKGLKDHQKELENRADEGTANLVPYFKVDTLNDVYKEPLLTAYCPSVTKDLAAVIADLNIRSYSSTWMTMNTPENRAEISSHIEKLTQANELLENCTEKLSF